MLHLGGGVRSASSHTPSLLQTSINQIFSQQPTKVVPQNSTLCDHPSTICNNVKRSVENLWLNLSTSSVETSRDEKPFGSDSSGNLSLQLVSADAMSSLASIPTLAPLDIRSYNSIEELELLNVYWQMVLVTVYTVTAIFALVGNVITICVLSGRRSSTGAELRRFLVNLSLSDITMAIFSIPFTYTSFMLGRWIFWPAFCPIVQMMQATSVFVSVYTLIVIGIDRYIAIIYPLHSARFTSNKIGLLTIYLIWVFGFALGLVQWYKSEAIPILVANQTQYECKETWTIDEQFFLTVFFFVVNFALPICILSYVYGSLAHKLFRHSPPGNADIERDRAQYNSKIKVFLFVLCWLPMNIINLLIYTARSTMETLFANQQGWYISLTIVAHWFSTANSCVNPIIYSFMSENFMSDLRSFLRRFRLLPSVTNKTRRLTLQSSQVTGRTSVLALSLRASSPFSSSLQLSNKGDHFDNSNGHAPGANSLDKLSNPLKLASCHCNSETLSSGSLAGGYNEESNNWTSCETTFCCQIGEPQPTNDASMDVAVEPASASSSSTAAAAAAAFETESTLARPSSSSVGSSGSLHMQLVRASDQETDSACCSNRRLANSRLALVPLRLEDDPLTHSDGKLNCDHTKLETLRPLVTNLPRNQ